MQASLLKILLHENPTGWRKYATVLGIIASIAAITWFDLITPPGLNFYVVYLIPVTASAWFFGETDGVLASILSASTILYLDIHIKRDFRNCLNALAIFSLASLAVSKVKKELLSSVQLSALKSSLLSAVSHDFGNSLAIMKSVLDLLRVYDQDAPKERLKLYAMLRRVSVVLQNETENFLNMARLESGRFALKVQPLDLGKTLRETVEFLQPLAESAGVDLRLILPVDTVVSADPAALVLVLQNLIGNAIKYSRSGGEVAVGINREDGDDRKVSVYVQDQGIGIKPEDLKRIKSGFFRTEEARNTAKGFGVGLKISNEMIEAHGSRLNVASAKRKGSRFSFSLEVVKPSEQ